MTNAPQLNVEMRHAEASHTQVAFSPRGHLLVSVGGTSASVWPTSTWDKHATLRGLAKLSTINWLDDNRLIAVDEDNCAAVWDVTSARKLQTFTDLPQGYIAVSVSPGRIHFAVGNVREVVIYEASTLDLVRRITPPTPTRGSPIYSFETDARLVVSNAYPVPKYLDACTGELLPPTQQVGDLPTGEQLLFSPDRSRAAEYSIGGEFEITLWDVANGKSLCTLDQLQVTVLAAAFSPDSRYLAGGDYEGVVVIWSAANGQTFASTEGHKSTISSLAFSPNSKILASAYGDGTIRIWDMPE